RQQKRIKDDIEMHKQYRRRINAEREQASKLDNITEKKQASKLDNITEKEQASKLDNIKRVELDDIKRDQEPEKADNKHLD
ncbi:14575_t:CDS:1, partial [Racocetra fulgida]